MKYPAAYLIFIFFISLHYLFCENSNTDPFSEMDALFDDSTEQQNQLKDFPIYGYVESKFIGMNLPADKNKWELLNAGKLKITIDKSYKQFRVHSELNCNYYAGFTKFNIFDFIPETKKNSLSPLLTENAEFAYENSITIFQAYGVATTGPVSFFIGRQPLSFGSGYVWNPSDSFSRKNILDPDYEVSSFDALQIITGLPLNGELRLCAAIEDSIKNASAGAALKLNLGGDIELTWQTRVDKSFNLNDFSDALNQYAYTVSITTNAAAAALLQDPNENNFYTLTRKHLLGLSFAGQIKDIGIHAEAGYSFSHINKGTPSWLLGIDYTFTFQNQILIEIMQDYKGKNNKNEYSTSDWYGLMTGERTGLGRTYGFFSTTQTLFDITEISLQCLINFSDTSVLLIPDFTVTISDNVTMKLLGSTAFGSTETEFAALHDSIELRATFYY
jgi:hypothetical protein